MALRIVTADERSNTATVKGQIWGRAGIGKTSLLKTLDPATTLCVDIEGGMLAVQQDDERGPRWMGDSIKLENWPEAKALLVGFQQNLPHLAKYKTVFIDSTTFVSKKCMAWCGEQPNAKTKDGKDDIWAVYRMLSEEMVGWVQGWKDLPLRNVWLVGGLERKKVDGVQELIPLLDGLKLHTELPYIMDYCFVMDDFAASDGKVYVGIFTNGRANPQYAHVPLKSRVSGLAPIEQPHLGKLAAKAVGLPQTVTSAPPPSSIGPALDGDASTPQTNEAA